MENRQQIEEGESQQSDQFQFSEDDQFKSEGTIHKINKYVITSQKLGQGVQGEVFKCYHVDNKYQVLCAKLFHRKKLDDSDQFQNLERECQSLALLQHDNIAQIIDIVKSKNFYYVIMNYCNGGTLEQLVEKRRILKEEEVQYIAKQIVVAFNFIQQKQIIHRDLKHSNIMLDFQKYPEKRHSQATFKSTIPEIAYDNILQSKPTIKIVDFGHSKIIDDDLRFSKFRGNPVTVSPEQIQLNYSMDAKVNFQSDVWALGDIIYYMCTGLFPFSGYSKDCNESPQMQVLNRKYQIPKFFQLRENSISIINDCLQFDNEERITWNQLLQHKFIQEGPGNAYQLINIAESKVLNKQKEEYMQVKGKYEFAFGLKEQLKFTTQQEYEPEY